MKYREILQDVCRKLEVYFHDYESTETIEKHLLEKVCMESVENMSEAELRSMAQELIFYQEPPEVYACCRYADGYPPWWCIALAHRCLYH